MKKSVNTFSLSIFLIPLSFDGCFGPDRNFILLALVVVLVVTVIGIIIMDTEEARAKRRGSRGDVPEMRR